MNPEADSLQAKLRLVDDYERKGLLRAEEAAAQRAALQKRLLQAVLPDTPAPRVPMRVRLRAIGAMAIVVGGVAAYLLTEYAGMNRRAIEMLEAGKAARASDAAARRERVERRRKIFSFPYFGSNDSKAKTARRSISLAHFQHRIGTAGIGQDCHRVETGK